MKDCFDLTGRVALITGGSSGLGVEFAKALAYRGADIALFARRTEKLKQVAKEIREFGHKVLPVTCDVTDEAQVAESVEQVIKEFNKIDILVNNAGTCNVVPTVEITKEQWHSVVDVNLEAVVFMTKYVAKHMIEANYGRIINISSMYGLRGSVTGPISPYWASKGAIPQLTRGWALEFAPHNITCNAIAPGFFPSELMTDTTSKEFTDLVKAIIPLARPGKVEEMDGLITMLASDGASYITGQTIPIDGGKTAI